MTQFEINGFTFRKSAEQDIPTLLHLASQAKETMRQSGNRFQWVDGYPSDEVFERDIALGGSVLMHRDGQPVATFTCLPSPEPTYAEIYVGQWLDDEKPYLVIHRIAAAHGTHGVLAALVDYCFTLTDNIRIDTHRDNVIMRHLLPRLGFSYCGIIYLLNGAERLAYQRLRCEPYSGL